MSKVVHLSNDAHTRAKQHCQRVGMRMSDWVGQLIQAATQAAAEALPPSSAPSNVRPFAGARAAPSAKDGSPGALATGHTQGRVTVTEATASEPPKAAAQEGAPLFAAPPFWACRGEVKPSAALSEPT